MANDYAIHLNFLPVVGEIPTFQIYRQLREDLSQERPANLDVRGYSLPVNEEDTEKRAQFWVSLGLLEGFEAFLFKPTFNNHLVQWALLKAVAAKARENLASGEVEIFESGFQPEIHFKMARHPEGSEELVIQPYLLRASKTFGLLADFHFRKGENVPFSRRIQQLSLSLDRNFKRNLDFYVEKLGKVNAFLRSRWNILSSLDLPEASGAVQVSKDFAALPAERLRSRVYVFGGDKESRSQFNGLREHGPLTGVTSAPRLLFVFREQDRQAARTLAMALKGAQQKERFSFPGFKSLFRTELQIDGNPVVVQDFSETSMNVALERVRTETGTVVPILVLPADDESAYLRHKALFAHAGVATQVCTLQVIQDTNTLKWATANIALQVFCKAGGQPWKVRPTTSERSLILGISQSHKTEERDGKKKVVRHFAFSVLTDSSGLFQKIQVLGDAENEPDYLSQLRERLKSILTSYAPQFPRVVIHTSFKLKHHEIAAIQKVIQEASTSEEAKQTRFAVIKINHKTRFFGANRSANSLVPFEGTCVRLGHGEFLVWFEGIFPDKPTVTKAFPGPTHLQFLHVSNEKHIPEHILLQELVNLSGANWRGFNAKSAPVSVFYCHLVADLVQEFQDRGLPLPAVEGLQPWFL